MDEQTTVEQEAQRAPAGCLVGGNPAYLDMFMQLAKAMPEIDRIERVNEWSLKYYLVPDTPHMETAAMMAEIGPKVFDELEKAEKAIRRTSVYVWRDRTRGFLVVTARNKTAAYKAIETEHPNWLTYAKAHEPVAIRAAAGNALYLPQRGRR